MLWLDLGLGCLLMWGAIRGYHAGWRKTLYSLGGLLCAAMAAALGVKGLRLLWKRYYHLEEIIKITVDSRLALPVSSPASGGTSPPELELPWFLGETLKVEMLSAAVTNQQLPLELLATLLGCTAAFLAGLFFWWGFFALCGFALAGENKGDLGTTARWGGALTGMIRQCCLAALLTGIVAPLAWLCGLPPHLLCLEKSFLARLAWQLFASLGIWR